MANLFRSLFGKHATMPGTSVAAPPLNDERDRNPVASMRFTDIEDGPQGVAAAHNDEAARREYDAFCAQFCFQPGRNFREFLEAEKVTRLIAWLEPQSGEPEPRAFIRLILDMIGRGQNVWDQPGISMLVEGRWSQGGGSSQESRDAISVLSQILGMPIKVYFRETPDGPLLVRCLTP